LKGSEPAPHIAQPTGDLHRIHIKEQEVERKDRKYGRYQSGSIWGPDRPTIFYIDTVPIGITLTEMTERVAIRYSTVIITVRTAGSCDPPNPGN
jgi:hypothetical protein